jgi:hypothetical protein
MLLRQRIIFTHVHTRPIAHDTGLHSVGRIPSPTSSSYSTTAIQGSRQLVGEGSLVSYKSLSTR